MLVKLALLALLCLFSQSSDAQPVSSFALSTPAGAYHYVVNGGTAKNPAVDVIQNGTVLITVAASPIHPVAIVTNPNIKTSYYSGASPQNISTGVITLKVQKGSTPCTLYYVCVLHGFFGPINTCGTSAAFSTVAFQPIALFGALAAAWIARKL